MKHLQAKVVAKDLFLIWSYCVSVSVSDFDVHGIGSTAGHYSLL